MPVLEVRGLEKRYGRLKAVRGVSLTVEKGQVYGFLGPNGSGKTTTLSCALGLLRPTAGEVRVLGIPAARIHETRGRVAAMFDAATLVPGLSVRENLVYAQKLLGHSGGRGVDEVLELVGLAALARQRAGGLSLGQSRRLAIARSLLGLPELLVLDEPLSGLDTVGVLDVLALFGRLREQGTTLVVSSHRMHEMERVVTHVGVILEGELVLEKPLEELLAGDVPHLLVTASPGERALEVLQRVEGLGAVEVVRPSKNGTPAELRVAVGSARVGAINRALVVSGVDVAGLVPERATLYSVFEALIERSAANRRGSAGSGGRA